MCENLIISCEKTDSMKLKKNDSKSINRRFFSMLDLYREVVMHSVRRTKIYEPRLLISRKKSPKVKLNSKHWKNKSWCHKIVLQKTRPAIWNALLNFGMYLWIVLCRDYKLMNSMFSAVKNCNSKRWKRWRRHWTQCNTVRWDSRHD